MIFLPKIALFLKEPDVIFLIEKLENYAWINRNIKTDSKFKYLLANVSISGPNKEGFNIKDVFNKYSSEIEFHNKKNQIALTPENCFIHFKTGNWSFYYPQDYENIMKSMDCYYNSFYSIDEYFIKSILD